MLTTYKKYFLLGLILFTLLLTVGCVDSFKKGVRDSLGLQDNEILVDKNISVEVPVLSYEAEKVVYYFCDSNNYDYCLTGLNKFASFSENYLHCHFKTIDDQFFANTLAGLVSKKVSVKIFFDREATYTINSYPREDSMYNFLLKNLIDVQNGSVSETFCVSDKGVLISTGFEPSINLYNPETSFYVIYNTDMSIAINKKFFEKYET